MPFRFTLPFGVRSAFPFGVRFTLPFGVPTVLLAAALAAALAGCATPYRAVDYPALPYTGRQTTGGVTFAYHYDAQPGAYGLRARRHGYAIVAVEATNTTAAPVVLDYDALRVRTFDRPVYPVSPATVADATRQPVLTHLLWGLLAYRPYVGDGNTVTIPIGAPVAAINLFVSRSANRRAAETYEGQSLFGQTVAPGQTAHGLLFLQTVDFVPLTFHYTPTAAPDTSGAARD